VRQTATSRITPRRRQLLFDRERVKLDKNLAGIKNLGRLPAHCSSWDAKKERIAVAEANKLGIPVVAIVDTNADPDLITVRFPERRRDSRGLADHELDLGCDRGSAAPDAAAGRSHGRRG